nr:tripartite tricarboxylate transporter TctB family protein [uncultured Cohaesibacter sp.]
MSRSQLDEKQALEVGEIARLISYILFLLVAVAMFVAAGDIPTSRFEKLGAGAFPQFVFAAIIVICLVAIILTVPKISSRAYGQFARYAMLWARRSYLVFVCLAALGVYLVAMPWLGFSLASLLFLFGLQMVLLPRSARTILIAAITSVVFSYGLNALFADVFTVFLPKGVF